MIFFDNCLQPYVIEFYVIKISDISDTLVDLKHHVLILWNQEK